MNVSEDCLPNLRSQPSRPLFHWFSGLGMMLVVASGWKYPLLGFVAPVVMALGISLSFSRGRYVCGNLCPRGSFLDTYLKLLAPAKTVSASLRAMPLRWTLLAVMMGATALQISADPASMNHWGLVFWRLCLVTTVIGVVLAFFFGARSWCAICPMGTLQNAAGGDKKALQIDGSCQECRDCEQGCPMGLTIPEHKAAGVLPHRDCLHCSTCKSHCPQGALSWPQ